MLIDRRGLLVGITTCLACSPARRSIAAEPIQQSVSKLSQIKGCFVDSNNANLMLGANMVTARSTEMPPEVKAMARSSGNPELDRSFDRALQRLAETFDVWPKVGFYDDDGAPNAMAMRYSVGDTFEFAVLFGRNYFKTLMTYDPSGITLLNTAAHEFAHIWVYRDGLFSKIQGRQSTVKRVELHADFLAGYYLGIRKRDNPQASFWAAGIRRWQSGDTEFNNAHHHGTPQERLAAAETGFKMGFLDNAKARDAFAAATSFVASK